MMFQLSSSDGSTGPRAFSMRAGSASVLSPNSASGPRPIGDSPPVPSSFVAVATAAGGRHQGHHQRDAEDPEPLHVFLPLLCRWRSPSPSFGSLIRASFLILSCRWSCPVGAGAAAFLSPRSRSRCSTPRMIRSPEINMPPMMTRPNTTDWRAVGRPIVGASWLRPVRNSAATNVESGLARPPVNEAPPIHPPRSAPGGTGADVDTRPTQQPGQCQAGRRVQDRGGHVDHDLVQAHADAHDARRDRVGADHPEPASDRRIAKHDADEDREADAEPEDGADPEDREYPIRPALGDRALDREGAIRSDSPGRSRSGPRRA